MANLVLTKNEEINGANEPAKGFTNEPHIVQAAYHPGPGLELLILTLSDGARLLVPREDLSELKSATSEQILDLKILPNGTAIWWPQLDDGIDFPEFLEFRWGNKHLVDRRDGGERYTVEGLE